MVAYLNKILITPVNCMNYKLAFINMPVFINNYFFSLLSLSYVDFLKAVVILLFQN